MRIEDVIALINAGFTKEEIVGFENKSEVEVKTSVAPQQTFGDKIETGVTTQNEESNTQDAKDVSNTSLNDVTEGLRKELNELKNTIHATNIRNSEMPEPKQETLVDIMNQLIN